MAVAGFDLSDFEKAGGHYDQSTGRLVASNGYAYDPAVGTWFDPQGKDTGVTFGFGSTYGMDYGGPVIPGLGGTSALAAGNKNLDPQLKQAIQALGSSRPETNFLTHSVLPAAALFAGGLALAPAGAAAGAAGATSGSTAFGAPAAAASGGVGAAAAPAVIGSAPFAGSVPAGAFGGTFGAGASGGLSTAAGAAGGSLLPAGISGIAGPVGGAAASGSLLTNLKNATKNPGGSVLQTVQNIAPKVLGAAGIVGGLLGAAKGAQSGGSSGGGTPPKISMAPPPPTRYSPNPFLSVPGLGKYSQEAYGLMGQVPPASQGDLVGIGTPYGNDAIPIPTVNGSTPLLPIAPGSGAYRPGVPQQRLLPAPAYPNYTIRPVSSLLPYGY